MPEPTRDQLEEALINADAAGDTDAAKRLALALKNGEYAQTPGINVTPAPAENPAARTGEVLQQADRAVRDIQDVEAQDLNARKGARDAVVRDPANNPVIMGASDPVMGENYVDPRTYDPDATFMDYMDFSDADQQAPILMQRGATMGAGDELVGGMASLMGMDGGEVRDVVNQYYSQAYEDSPIGAMALELGGGIPSMTSLYSGLGKIGLGPRGISMIEGGAYAFNDPFTEGDGLLNRSANAAGGAVVGNLMGAIGKSGARETQRQANVWSGADTIQRVADEEFGITLTEGQITRDPKLFGQEDNARKGALKSESANRAARDAFNDQERDTLMAARSLGGADPSRSANQAASDFGAAVVERTGQQRKAVQDAYDEAASYGAKMTEEGVSGMPQAVRGRMSQDNNLLLDQLERGVVAKEKFPGFLSAVRMIDDMAANNSGPLDFQMIEYNRQNLNRLIDKANKQDARAILSVKSAFDEAIDDAVTKSLFQGDSQFIDAYKNARSLHAKFERDWGANKVFETIVENNATPEQVINLVLGGSKLANDKNYGVLLQLKEALADDPEAWADLQDAYIKKLFRQTEKTFNPKVMRDTLDELLLNKNQSFAQLLFDDQQYQQLRRFRSVVDSMIPPEGARNTSNTTIDIRRAINESFGGVGRMPGVQRLGRVLSEGWSKLGVSTEGMRVKRQLNPPRGLDTRRIEEGFPENRFTPSADQLPGAGAGRQPRSLQEGIEQASRGEPPTTTPSSMAEAMNAPKIAPKAPTFGRRQPPPEPVTPPVPEEGMGGGPREPQSLMQAVDAIDAETPEAMVRSLQQDGFDIVDVNDLNRALENERMGLKTYRKGQGEAYEMELDSYQAMLDEDDPVQNGLPAFNRSKPGVRAEMPEPGTQGSGIQMQLKDGTPTTIGKIYELATSINPETNRPWTRAEIADEMMVSKNQVSVTYHKLRKAGYAVDVVPSVSAIGARGEKGQMMLALKRQGLSNNAIADRVNQVYGKDVVHGGRDTTPQAVGVALSKMRQTMRGRGEVVDFGLGMIPGGAAIGMSLTEGEQSEEQALNMLGTDEEKRAAMARAMLGGR